MHRASPSCRYQETPIGGSSGKKQKKTMFNLDARFQNPPVGGFKHVESLCGMPGIVSLLKTWFFQLCMIASTLFWSNSMDTFNGLIVLRIHF